jgi:hypothetical protein
MLMQELQGVSDVIRKMDDATGGQHRGEADRFIRDVEVIASAVQSLDSGDPSSAGRLSAIYTGQIQPLRARVERWSEQLRGGREGVEVIKLRLPKSTM